MNEGSIEYIDLQNKFKDIHKGKMGFLLGCGVSLEYTNLELIKPYVTMCVMESIFKFKNPTYFTACDGFIYEHGILKEAVNNRDTISIIDENIMDSHGGDYNCYSDKILRMSRKWNSNSIDRNTLGKNDDKIIVGYNSAHPGAHLLHIMGCDPIVLIGIDGQPLDGYIAFYTLPEVYKNLPKKMKDFYGDEPNKKITEYFKGYIGELHASTNIWKEIRTRSPEVNIINSSIRSAIECFPKMSLEEILIAHGDRKNK